MAHIEDHDGTPVLRHLVGGKLYGFSVQDFPENKRDWLCRVIASMLNEVHHEATRKAERELKMKIRETLGLQEY